MATLDFLPATTYRPPTSPVQAQKKRRALNTIMEDDEESMRGSKYMEMRGRDRSPQNVGWLSPLSDHFPTPRANHFIQPYRSPSPSCSNSSKNSIEAPSSAPWTRTSFTTDATDFDDLYDVSSDEDNRRNSTMRRSGSVRRRSLHSNRSSTGSISSRISLPSLVIPNNEDPWAEVTAYKLQMTSPVPPTPPPKVAVSPAVLSYLKTQQDQPLLSSSTPPSLDGSMDSEHMAQLSAPPTPDIGYDSEDDGPRANWGVQLQPSAMATLEAIAGSGDDYLYEQPEQVIQLENIPEENIPVQEMQQRLPPLNTNLHRHNSIVLTPGQQRAMEGLTNLEIPSPGGFFASLGQSARHTWHLVPITPDSPPPPSSTTAENFYAAPWAPAPVERIVEVPEPADTDGPPTARMARPEIRHDSSEETVVSIKAAKRVEEEIVVDEMLTDYAPGYISKLEDTAAANLDRTALWLAAQNDYLSALINPTEARDDEVALLKRAASIKLQAEVVEVAPTSPVSVPVPVPAVPVRRKTVRFSKSPESNSPTSAAAAATATLAQLAGDCCLPKAIPQESTFHRAFKRSVRKTRGRDVFVHRVPRFEALQSQRVSFPAAHRAHLLGKYQLSVLPMSPRRRMSSNVARGDDTPFEDPEKLKNDKEVEALDQMTPATWNVMAAKLLNGGRLFAAPVAKRLARLSSMGPTANGTRERARILDLGGQATCDWAWHCATEYPNCKVYTVTTKSLRQLSNSNIRGPKNLRQVAVDRLVKLPWKDNQFDLISAREIYSILKERSENGEDEWEACLKECMRILKPGGYLEFSIMDSDIVNAGPMGLAKSVEFGFNLKTLGYDPSPTKLWLGRLKRAGFDEIKRAWIFLPMGADPQHKMEVERNSVGDPLQMEAMISGSTDDAACVTGLVGGWAWEKWMLRCRIQTVGNEGSLEGVQHLIEEGRACGAGWRTVNGWARKPVVKA